MQIDDVTVTRKIVERFFEELKDSLEVDVVIAGAGPAGLTAARLLAEKKKKVLIIERKLSPGGGMWGGGMTFPVIVVQEESKRLLTDVGIRVKNAGKGYYTANSIEAVAKLCSSALDAGASMLNALSVEDVMMRKNRITGVVVNWSAVEIAGLHVDPLTIGSRFVVDATGHAAEVCNVVQRKTGKLATPSGKIEGEKSMWAEVGEDMVVKNTKEIFPGLFVAGMAANAVLGAPRMGPIFGGMLLSGERAANLILKKL